MNAAIRRTETHLKEYLMKRFAKKTRRGFSLVELLAVVLILAVLAAVAVPLYLNTRKTSAARACKGNISAIMAAESARALRDGKYVDMATLVGSGPEALASTVTCPLGDADASGAVDAYAIETGGVGGTAVPAGGTALELTISCPNAAAHATALGTPATAADWQKTMAAISSEGGTP